MTIRYTFIDFLTVGHLVPNLVELLKLLQTTLFSAFQIHAVAKKEFQYGDSPAVNSNFRISDIPIAAFGSRAHLEEKALASV